MVHSSSNEDDSRSNMGDSATSNGAAIIKEIRNFDDEFYRCTELIDSYPSPQLSDDLVFLEVHYNQQGLLLLEGQGIYRLGENWYQVLSGDAIWMAPFVQQCFWDLGC
ncbi:hypothetical protein MKW98_032510 [Papaver atlanticum]|uniref:Uncharacterized protein n=1 Tax=Papaver atlanticum TaxID=357466 RepID=A0AAD4XL06_9MAGN|nr:hypothetical protein MKW98_032510 [Papaver atlanticum]